MPVHQELPGFERSGPGEQRISAHHQLVKLPLLGVLQHALQRGSLAVDVGNAEKTHGEVHITPGCWEGAGPVALRGFLAALSWSASVLARRTRADFPDRIRELVKLLAATRSAGVAARLAAALGSADQRGKHLRAALIAVLASARQQAHTRGAAEREAQVVC